MAQLLFFRDNSASIAFQDIAYRLLLREDKASLGRRFVDGNDQNRRISGLKQVAYYPVPVFFRR
ncbi:hypothetical protein D3C71_1542090 [compost metagenome]